MMSLFLYRFSVTLLFLFLFRLQFQFRFRFRFSFPFLFLFPIFPDAQKVAVREDVIGPDLGLAKKRSFSLSRNKKNKLKTLQWKKPSHEML